MYLQPTTYTYFEGIYYTYQLLQYQLKLENNQERVSKLLKINLNGKRRQVVTYCCFYLGKISSRLYFIGILIKTF